MDKVELSDRPARATGHWRKLAAETRYFRGLFCFFCQAIRILSRSAPEIFIGVELLSFGLLSLQGSSEEPAFTGFLRSACKLIYLNLNKLVESPIYQGDSCTVSE